MREINIRTNNKNNDYQIIIKHHLLEEIDKYIPCENKILIITDSNIPNEYINMIKNRLKTNYVYIVKAGEKSKSLESFEKILGYLSENEFTRKDVIVALGGGVVGDLAGFVASSYMRGIDFYNVPTTLLSQVDSSIGGKVAVDLGVNNKVIKNIVGAFYFPKKVLIDPETLRTLDKRILYEGLFEAIKMSMTFDEDLFALIEESDDLNTIIDEVIYKSLLIKQMVVENDPFEYNLRKTLNFGHTIGHAIESSKELVLYHGEAVGYGMLYVTSKNILPRLSRILHKYGLTNINIDNNDVLNYLKHDKKREDFTISMIFCEEIGSYQIRKLTIQEIEELLKENLCATF